jgi:hypothetical protein
VSSPAKASQALSTYFKRVKAASERHEQSSLPFHQACCQREIKAGYFNIRVEQYIPNPLRCFKCQKFGHHRTACKRDAICAKCGLPDHGENPCSSPAHCVNCNGDHPAFFTTCPTWITEKEICKIKSTLNLSYPEARKRVTSGPQTQVPTAGVSYARAAGSKPVMKSIATQTDVTNCKCVPQIRPKTPAKGDSSVQTDDRSPTARNSPKTTREAKNIQDRRAPGNVGRASSLSPRRSGTATTSLSKDKSGKAAEKLGSSKGDKLSGRQTDRPQKGSVDTVQNVNRFVSLEDYEMSDPPLGTATGKLPLKKIFPPK